MSVHQQNLFKKDEIIKPVNVAQVKQLSPFRYPGGKTWFVPTFHDWLRKTSNTGKCLVEPFTGGGIISLSVAYINLVDKCIMIEKDEEVAAVWKTILYGDWCWLADKIVNFDLNIENANEVLKTSCDRVEELAFKTILKNRIYHGGILAKGSGILKKGENGKGILSRWYPETLAKRIATIAAMKNKLEFYEGDAFEYIQKYSNSDNLVFFIDPPYTASKKKAGKRLYRYNDIDHNRLFDMLNYISGDFLLTYDDDETIIELATQHNLITEKIPMKGTHHNVKHELVITK
jgi:DNA adenine methylase